VRARQLRTGVQRVVYAASDRWLIHDLFNLNFFCLPYCGIPPPLPYHARSPHFVLQADSRAGACSSANIFVSPGRFLRSASPADGSTESRRGVRDSG
jgi:hypothetical protein